MAKIIKINLRGLHTASDHVSIPLYDEGETPTGGAIHVWFSSDRPLVLNAVSPEGALYPLHVGRFLDQTYHLDEGVLSLELTGIEAEEVTNFAYRVTFNATGYRDRAAGPPKRAVVPLDANSFQNRVMRAVQAQLAALGLHGDTLGKGHRYEDADPDSDLGDPEFGRGYEYSETAEEEIEKAATAAVAARFAKPDRVQRREPADTSREPVSDDQNERKRSLHDPVIGADLDQRDAKPRRRLDTERQDR